MPINPSNQRHPIVTDLIDRLDQQHDEQFQERAGILTHEAGVEPMLAESLAILDLVRIHPMALSGITVIQIELDGATEWLLTTDVDYASTYLATIHAKEVAVVNLAEVLAQQYGGVALLTALG